MATVQMCPDGSRCVQLPTWCDSWDKSRTGTSYLHLDMRSGLRPRAFLYLWFVNVNFSPSCYCMSVGASEVGMSGQNPHSRARSRPPGRAAARDGEHTTHMSRTGPPRSDTLPGVFRCPVWTASPPPGCSQVVLLASSLCERGGRNRSI